MLLWLFRLPFLLLVRPVTMLKFAHGKVLAKEADDLLQQHCTNNSEKEVSFIPFIFIDTCDFPYRQEAKKDGIVRCSSTPYRARNHGMALLHDPSSSHPLI